ncbi:cysteine-rich VLP protein [Christensenellaceae bacterium NSJ-63]|uniref:Cysteine-rich VLP protein n=1 Tax=Guopingia tenuis TaxID=2763656 RepID=A0A926DH78_9FIRM|nr:cysteine-rich VLP protein [Guopingia tenuis]
MATLKHINSKNADYGAAEQYLLFEHDEFTMKPVLDETGRLIPREDYRLSTLNCGGEDFAVACMRANLRYEKNQRREDVKSHHYIISFDPRDGPDNGLTVDRAQALGEKFCAEHFPGHQALVCTHPDGHNHSGNIHVHIVINSLRIEEVPFLPYMDRPADTKAGCKHRCTDAALRYFKSEVMEMCHREGLYQIDLLNGSKNRVTDREYWAQKKGQAALDKQNAPMIAGGITPRQTKFETNKEKLRQTIRAALSAATSFEDFSSLLLREGVAVKESRGRLSYLTPDRTKPITARKLGDDFDRAAVLAVLEQNAQRGVTVHSVPQPQTHAAGAAERSRAMSDNLPRMDYRQHRRARRLVHECCNYDGGNCLLLDDGEPCVCVQSISLSLMCRWFRVAVLPLDGELAAALLYRGSRKRCAVCGAAFVPKSNRGKYCPDCAGRMKKIKAAERKRKQRHKCHALEPFKPA